MFPQGGGAGWGGTVYPQDASSPYPRDPRMAARANYQGTNQVYEAGSGWSQGWAPPAQWPYVCPPTSAPSYPAGWVPNASPQPGVNCPPIGIPPPVGDWSNYTGLSYTGGPEEKRSEEQGGSVPNGCGEVPPAVPIVTDESLFLLNYCNAQPARHLVPVSPAKQDENAPEPKSCAESNHTERKPLVEKVDKALSERSIELPAEKKDNSRDDPRQDTPTSPTCLGEELGAVERPTSLKRKAVSLEKPDSTSGRGDKRLLFENSSCTTGMDTKLSPLNDLDGLISMGRKGAAMEKPNSASNLGKNEATVGKPDSATNAWVYSSREKKPYLGKQDMAESIRERGAALGRPDRIVSIQEKRTSLGKPERTSISREKGTSFFKPSVGKTDQAASSRDKRPSLEKLDWTAITKEREKSLEKPNLSEGKNMDNAAYRTVVLGGSEVQLSHPIQANNGVHKAADRVEHQASHFTATQEGAENLPDVRTAAILAKKDEIERDYQQNCRTFFLVAAMLLEREPSIQQTVVSALRKTLREMGKHCVQELQNFIERYDLPSSRR
ncbi:uncharacterized protein [Ambystoma mexicanum]|uniref:uncharacterized protein n=1 Tax=Ambystoma mexicanum TaxID=8296 RepID=UPI0037E97928